MAGVQRARGACPFVSPAQGAWELGAGRRAAATVPKQTGIGADDRRPGGGKWYPPQGRKATSVIFRSSTFPQVTKPSSLQVVTCFCFTESSPTKRQWVELKQNASSLASSGVSCYLATDLCVTTVSFHSHSYHAIQCPKHRQEEQPRAQ